MKKLTLLLFTLLFAGSTFAQDIAAGFRVGSGIQAVGVYNYKKDATIEARFGASWNNDEFIIHYGNVNAYEVSRIMLDFSLLHTWRLLNMDWTPSLGKWFVDGGAGVNVGGRANYAYAGVMGMARIGLSFFELPLTVTFDWSPSFGPNFWYNDFGTKAGFNGMGIANLGVSCIYRF